MPALQQYFEEQGITLEEGHQAEVCFEACDWIENAGRVLERGFVLSIDYGHEARNLYKQHHNRGTLLAYRDHAVVREHLVRTAPGEQDLTAHINFTARRIYAAAGWAWSAVAWPRNRNFWLRWAARMSSPICMNRAKRPLNRKSKSCAPGSC